MPRRRMPRGDYKTCKACGKHTSEVGPLSNTRLCQPCGIAIERQNFISLKTHSGPPFQYWRRRIVASAGGVILDDLTSNP